MLRAGSLLGFALCAMALASGCTYGDHHSSTDNSGYVEGPECGGPVRQGSIDTDGLIDVEAAEGVGVFVEYTAGGHWHVFASCDSNVSRKDCLFDVVVHAVGTGGILGAAGDDLEADDSVSLFGEDGVQMVSYTDYDFDGFWFDTAPGTGIRIDVLLDDWCASSYVYWVGGGAVHEGAPSRPFELVPSSP
ncbi:MAG: hypothetical protein ACOY0T_29805 [Myxococcota bacterium]